MKIAAESQTGYISRQGGILALRGVRATTLDSLLDLLGGNEQGLVVADLSLGAWRGHHVASEFRAQLGLGSSVLPSSTTQTGDVVAWGGLAGPADASHADFAGAWIDTEAGGDRVTLAALGMATEVSAAASARGERLFVVVIPRYGLPWEDEDVCFVRFLSQGLRERDIGLVLACTDSGDDPELPENWAVEWQYAPDWKEVGSPHADDLLGLVPGVIDPEVVEALGDAAGGLGCVPLKNGRTLIAPERRRPPEAVPHQVYDLLAAKAPPGWLESYGRFRGSETAVEPQALCAEAHWLATAGSYGSALRLVERAASCSQTPVQVALCQLQAQGTNIRLNRFQEAATAPAPSPDLPQEIGALILQNKGWGFVMLNDTERAEPYLREARARLKPFGHSREYLYLLNISALNWLKSGHTDKALALERAIEAVRLRHPERDHHLAYINSINIARLYGRRGDLNSSERYYERAFATTLGARSESDSVYTNVCWAKLEERRGMTEQAFA